MGQVYCRVLQEAAAVSGPAEYRRGTGKRLCTSDRGAQGAEAKLTGFAWNVEPKDVFRHAADVVVCDGFTGNVFLKTIEGTAEALFAMDEEFAEQFLQGQGGRSDCS